METYTTLEEIKTSNQTQMFGGDQFKLRPEQREAIDKAKDQFCTHTGRKPNYVYTIRPEFRQYLWNAKMRFGKTVCALQLAREMDVKRTLIVTHRPVVSDSWLEAFKQTFGNKIVGNDDISANYFFGMYDDTKNTGNYYDLEKFVETDGNHYVFFVSMHYIRLSELVNEKTLAKNLDENREHSSSNENEKLKADILNTDWDLVVIDEAHEGTRTALGKRVIDEFLKKEKTKMLHLSGTPFNLYEDFKKEEIFTWDYISEQQAKLNWSNGHPDEKNPYAELPQMKIYTYDVTQNFDQVMDMSGIFTFTEFFRTWTGNPKADRASMPEGAKGRFVHEEEVNKFLKLLCTKDDKNNFPFSTDEYRKMFRHTLWVVSHVDEAKALSTLLKEHPIFKRFTIVNVAGNGDDDEQRENALDAVKKAIGDLPEKTATITISCGRLTTGVTVEPWSAVLYLKGGDRAATYMQTIFRVQSPYKTADGKMKTTCHVFDFMPDRTLKIVAETAKFSSITKTIEQNQNEEEEDKPQDLRDKETVRDFIDLCPVISMEGGMMSPLDVNTIYKQLENVFIDRLVRKGFDDPCLYVQDELNKIDKDLINHIGENGGQAPDEKRKDAGDTLDLAHMPPEQRAEWEAKIAEKIRLAEQRAAERARRDAEFKKQWESWTKEQREEWKRKEAEKQALREKKREEREEFKKRISNISGIARRIPLLMYGGADAGDANDDITIDNFTRKIKDESWAEFMPRGITKEDFTKIKRCFNATRFMEAGKKYRELVREADFMHVEERIKQITEIFSYFRNPDKETVLTPWRVVNMHMSDTLGGYCFYDETFDDKNGQLEQPRFVDQGDVTKRLFDNVDKGGEVQTKILEINSKTGLYPLYVTYSLYKRRLEEYVKAECVDLKTISVQEEQVVWDDIVTDNIFVICNTPMAVGITRRTLFGFRKIEKKANIKAEKIIFRVSNDRESLIKNLKTVGFWKGNTNKKEMKFDAIVGNPPYQVSQITDRNATNSQLAGAIYPAFIDIARIISEKYVSMITPSRWLSNTGRGVKDEWVDKLLHCNHFITMHDFHSSEDCFKNVEIKGGVNYFLYDKQYEGKCIYVFNIGGKSKMSYDILDSLGLGVVVRDLNAISIINKVKEKEGDSIITNNFSSIVSPSNFFTDCANGILTTRWAGYQTNRDEEHNIKYYLNKKMEECGYGWINENDIPKGRSSISLNKVYISEAYNGGDNIPHQIIGVPFFGEIGSVCSQTYILIGYDSQKHHYSKEECLNIISYIKTRFFRYLVSIKKKTQHTISSVFELVPIQDFSKSWTDEELFNKYEIDSLERKHIESLVKPME